MFVPKPAWTGAVVSKMHRYSISVSELASEANISRQYLSQIMSGHVESDDWKRAIQESVERIVERRCKK